MDPNLLRERELFKKRALCTPAVEKRPTPSSDSSSSKKKKAKVEQSGSSSSKPNTDHSNGTFNLKALSGGSGYKFGVLAKIVNYMKTRHQRGDTHPLTLEEILDETQHLDIGLKQKQWLMSEALVSNPKIEVIDGKYAFKPKYNLKDKKALLRLLDKHDQRGLGGILLEDIEEGLPNAQKAIKETKSSLLPVLIRRKSYSTMIKAVNLQWMKAPIQKRKKPASQKKRRFKTHNDHLAGVLKDYSDVVPGK
ncbi:General transcription factor IIE subunit 2 [Ophiophagus hannah]|uniref:Transcription initiation factor IIE subunit beta n=1 Tax=Ophiophagus hannah TaxID=8665 RepID=V8PGJ4_OPHHA|nr:General transcription factor IIE subunit 2 [Ophiophagus hannah]